MAIDPIEALLLADGSDLLRVLSLRDYNTRIVVLATTMLGLAAGLVGSFTLLRRRALLGDALSHATLPGIALAFLVAPMLGLEGKSLAVLLIGAGISGVVGMGAIVAIRNSTKLKEDAALGIVLSVFFGGGLALLGLTQQSAQGHAAGLESFIYGKTASIIAQDAWWIAATGALSFIVLATFYKELKLLCFDDGFTLAEGYSTIGLDFILMATVVLVTIVGLQAVGLVLMIALLVIPAAAARFWTTDMLGMAVLSATIGAASCLTGSLASAILPRLPSGALIVIASAIVFVFSMLAGSERGVIAQLWRRWRLRRRIDRRHALRGIFELLESEDGGPDAHVAGKWVAVKRLLASRSWSSLRLSRELQRLRREGLVRTRNGDVTLTTGGLLEAKRLTREHRLWELYLITHADVATERVDRDAERIEDCLEPVMIDELESLLSKSTGGLPVPVSPHAIPLATSPAELSGSQP